MKRAAVVLLALATPLVMFAEPRLALIAAAMALTAAWILDAPAVRAGLRFGVVLAVVFAAAVTTAVMAWAEGPVRGLETGGLVLLRLMVLVAAAAVLVRAVDADAILRATDRLGMQRLGLVLGLALNSLPRIAETAGEAWWAYRLRYVGLRARIRHLPGMGEALLAHTARIADEAAAAASLRGHSALTRPGVVLPSAVRTVVVTGPSGGGKTRAVSEFADHLLGRGIPVAGFVQPGEVERDHKVSFSVRDVASGDEVELARLDPRGNGDFGTRFRFSDAGFDLARKSLERAPPGSILIVDELGPVELRGDGHMPGVRTALSRSVPAGAVIVVRRTLVPAFLAALDATDAVVVDVGTCGDEAPAAIAHALGLHME